LQLFLHATLSGVSDNARDCSGGLSGLGTQLEGDSAVGDDGHEGLEGGTGGWHSWGGDGSPSGEGGEVGVVADGNKGVALVTRLAEATMVIKKLWRLQKSEDVQVSKSNGCEQAL
jgi:hypothetical protein